VCKIMNIYVKRANHNLLGLWLLLSMYSGSRSCYILTTY